MTFTTRITTADGQAVTVTSQSQPITDWTARYLGTWWNASPTTPGPATGPAVVADIDPQQQAALTAHVTSRQPQEVTYASARMLVVRDGDGTVRAVQPDEGLAYEWDPAARRLVIMGTEETAVATATARLAREMVRSQLLGDGWHILHASAVSRPSDGATLLTLGKKGAGKTTTALLLARTSYQLLANDRVFVRVEGDRVRILPWPSAAALGFGLLDALDLYEPVRARLASGQQMHPTQNQKVTDALLAGDRTPLWRTNGTEMKPQFFPDQLRDWLSLPLATEGHAAGILFPEIVRDAEPQLGGTAGRALGADDFLTAGTEDRYPDVFGLLPATRSGDDLADRLAQLPHQAVTMSHDTTANTTVLEKAAAQML